MRRGCNQLDRWRRRWVKYLRGGWRSKSIGRRNFALSCVNCRHCWPEHESYTVVVVAIAAGHGYGPFDLEHQAVTFRPFYPATPALGLLPQCVRVAHHNQPGLCASKRDIQASPIGDIEPSGSETV